MSADDVVIYVWSFIGLVIGGASIIGIVAVIGRIWPNLF